jgi:flagellar basal-body rod protein FlgF
MSSGMYSALSGNLARMQGMETIANNLANGNTFGYKRDRLSFESFLSGTSQTTTGKGLNFTRLQGSFTDFTLGSNQHTGNSLDLAIDGEGFFKVKRGNEFLYTRNGVFHLSPDGSLLTNSNMEVVGENGQPLTFPADEFSIDEDGKILAAGMEVGRIGIFTVEDPNALTKEGSSMFRLPADQLDQVADNPKVLQGYLETSNVNMMEEMVLMMEALRAFEAHQKMIKTYGNIGSKADDLGSL